MVNLPKGDTTLGNNHPAPGQRQSRVPAIDLVATQRRPDSTVATRRSRTDERFPGRPHRGWCTTRSAVAAAPPGTEPDARSDGPTPDGCPRSTVSRRNSSRPIVLPPRPTRSIRPFENTSTYSCTSRNAGFDATGTTSGESSLRSRSLTIPDREHRVHPPWRMISPRASWVWASWVWALASPDGHPVEERPVVDREQRVDDPVGGVVGRSQPLSSPPVAPRQAACRADLHDASVPVVIEDRTREWEGSGPVVPRRGRRPPATLNAVGLQVKCPDAQLARMSSGTPLDRSTSIQHLGRLRRRQRHVPRDLDRVRSAQILVRRTTQSSGQPVGALEHDTDESMAAWRSEFVGTSISMWRGWRRRWDAAGTRTQRATPSDRIQPVCVNKLRGVTGCRSRW